MRALLSCAVFVIAIVAAELLLRAVRPQLTFSRLDVMAPRCFRPSDVVPAELLPGARTHLKHLLGDFDTTIAIDGQGLRMDREVLLQKRSGRARVAIVGDSFAFGWGVEASEAFPQRLEQLERARDVEVLNLGFAYGFSPDCYYAALRRPTPEVACDVLVLALFVGNDLTVRAETRWLDLDAHGLPRRVVTDFTAVDDEARFRQRETLWCYRHPCIRESHLVVGLARLVAGTIDPDLTPYGRTLRAVYDKRLYAEPWPDAIEDSFAQIGRCIVALSDLARDRHQKFLVVVIPTREQVYEDFTIGAQRYYKLRSAPRDGVPQRRLAQYFAAHEIESLDLLEPLVRAQDPDLYFHNDGHFTRRGHDLAAHALATALERRGWLP